MRFYEDKAETVKKLLAKFGQTVTLVRDTGGSFDPVTGTVTPGTTDFLDFKGVLKNVDARLIDGTTIMQGDKLLVLDASHTPEEGDKVEGIDGNWQIVRIESLNPAGVALAYKVQVRR